MGVAEQVRCCSILRNNILIKVAVSACVEFLSLL